MVDVALARTIAQEHYGVFGEFSTLPSERDQNFLISVNDTPSYVLKVSSAHDTKNVLDLQNKAMEHIIKKSPLFSVPRVIPSRNGELIVRVSDRDGKQCLVRLLTYIHGTVLAKALPHSPCLLRDFGRFLGYISAALSDFEHDAAHRDFVWDLKNVPQIVERHLELISDSERREVIEHFYRLYECEFLPDAKNLRKSVAHNDANDYNVLIEKPWSDDRRTFGIIDFGDMVFTYTIADLAIGIAYAILDKPDPLMSAVSIVSGYHQVFPLSEDEIRLLFPLVCARLIQSVCMSAAQASYEPDNEYLRVSEDPAWRTLAKLRGIHPRLAWYAFRDACGFPAHPESIHIEEWLECNRGKFASVLDLEKPVVVDLSVGSRDYASPDELNDIKSFNRVIVTKIEASNASVGIGRYNEARLMYVGAQYKTSTFESRTIHLGMDLFSASGTPIYAPVDGKVHALKNNNRPYDNGPTIILKHQTDEGFSFFTLYAHLTEDSLDSLKEGDSVTTGQEIARIGEYPSNGGWPPHLHFQIILDMFDFEGDYYGVCAPNQRSLWTNLCPDPNLLLGVSHDIFSSAPLTAQAILDIRNQHLGRNLSVSYKSPLKIVRGWMQYLYDEDGRRYLDVVNNVPTVGHCHPMVVKAIQDQAKVLYTNTRYLHDNLARYIKRLCALFPEPLKVCFLVNSGSEANELAIRLAKAHTKRSGFIALEGGYHGNTDNLIGLSHYKHAGPGGHDPPPNVEIVPNADVYRSPYSSVDGMGKKHAEAVKTGILNLKSRGYNVAGFICEPVMSCAGQVVFPSEYLKHVYEHVRAAGGVCIADEVQIGFGRMGTHFWGFETQDVVPDIVTLGKPIGNGHPMGAVVTTPEIAASFDTGMEFFSTTGGNTVSCAVGLAVLDVIDNENLQENARIVGEYFKQELLRLKSKYPLIGDVRGIGLFLGVELIRAGGGRPPAVAEAHHIVKRMKELGVLLSVDGIMRNVLKIKPPLCFTKENVDEVVSKLGTILQECLPKAIKVGSS